MYSRAVLLILGSIIISIHALEPRIVGGHDAEPGKYPYQAMIRRSSIFICGGSIISKRYILTAAHCIYKEQRINYKVHVGTYSVKDWATVYQAEKLIWHPDFENVSLLNDIGLIYLTKDITYTNKVKPIDLATEYTIPTNQIAVVTGWGRTAEGGPVSTYLQEIFLNIISHDLCSNFWIDLVKSTHICTLTNVQEGVCNGDSGGPLVVKSKQIGIVSFGAACARGRPDVYTRVYSYKPWIEQNTDLKWSHGGATNIFLNTWIQMLLVVLTYLHISRTDIHIF